MNHRTTRLLSIVFVAITLGVPIAFAQDAQPTPPANAYRGLVPGEAEFDAVANQLGPSPIATANADDLRYPVEGQSQLNDRLYFRNGRLALVTAASPDKRYPTRAAIIQRLGEPESQLLFQTQEYLDYSALGLRFLCKVDGPTTGVLYFQPTRRRVPAGLPNNTISIRRQLPPPQPATAPADFRVGAGQVSIAPLQFDNLTGLGDKLPLKLGEDVFARAAVFEQGETKIVIVGVDVFGLGPWDINKIRESLAGHGFPEVIIAMSHTHANVDTIGFYGYYPQEYAQHIRRQVVAAVVKAAANLQPVKMLKSGSVEMSLAGGRVVDLVRNGRDPGIVDPTASILQAIGVNGKPIVNLIHMACHPEVIRLEDERGISPDYVGTLCNEVTQQLGGQTVFLNGALGGMLTPDVRFRTQQAAEEMGRKLAPVFVRAANAAQPAEHYHLWIKRRPVVYPVTGESVAAFLRKPPTPVDFYQGRVHSEMSVLWIGDAQFITVPGEPLPEIGLEIMSHMTGRLRLIVGLANGELGYLVPAFDFREGGYEERTGPGAAGGPITRSVGLELASERPE